MTNNDERDSWAPARIWLQRGIGEGGSHTWCENHVGDDDLEEIEYVRADLAARQPAAATLSQIAGDLWDASINCDFDAFRAEVAKALPAAATGQEPVGYRYRHSERESWHYGATRQNWWECQPLYAAPIGDNRAGVEGDVLSDPCEHEWQSITEPHKECVKCGDVRRDWVVTPRSSQPPFANCQFRICDLPGQCRAEGKCHHPAAQPAESKRAEVSDAEIVAAARALANHNADVCNVNREDNWAIYGNDFIESAKIALDAAHAASGKGGEDA